MAKQPKKWTHQELCDKAVKWLRRPHGQFGHGCQIAMSETQSGWSGEIPDAIGFRSSGHRDGSVVVEVKVSRSDFLADKKKPHRNGEVTGLGTWRYYLCPEGLIQPDDLPEKWGLLWITNRGGVKPVVGPALDAPYWGKFEESLQAYKWDRDHEREQFILVKMLARVGDPEQLNKMLKKARSERAYFEKRYRERDKQYNEMSWKCYRLTRKVEAVERQQNAAVTE